MKDKSIIFIGIGFGIIILALIVLLILTYKTDIFDRTVHFFTPRVVIVVVFIDPLQGLHKQKREPFKVLLRTMTWLIFVVFLCIF